MVAVGRLKKGWAADACADYQRRSQRLLPIDVHEVRDVPRRKGEPATQVMAKEAEGIAAAIEGAEVVVCLDERGKGMSSRAFADWLAELRDTGRRSVAFVIGGPDGLDPALRGRADRLWALGPATMPHELARVVLMEQIYRAGTLWAGLPYHRD